MSAVTMQTGAQSGLAVLVIMRVLLWAPLVLAQTGAPIGEWPSYGGDDGSTQYAPLDQIDAGNVNRLQVAWQWESPDTAVINEQSELEVGAFKATPLMVDGVLYIGTSLSIVAAIDAATGKELWVRDVASYEAGWASGRPTNLGFNSRGVAHWSDGDDARIFLATGDAHLWSFDAVTGQPIGWFGADGKIDLTQGLRPSGEPRRVPGDLAPAGGRRHRHRRFVDCRRSPLQDSATG